jgi:hypothetical protein
MGTKPAYAFKPGFFKPVSAQVVGEEIERIRLERGAFFQTDDLVDGGRREDSILHPAFEWDSEIGAEEWRKQQARQLISHITIVDENKPPDEQMRAYVSVPTSVGPRYTTVAHAFAVPELRACVLSQALADLETFKRRYECFIELAESLAAVEKVSAKLRRRKLQSA